MTTCYLQLRHAVARLAAPAAEQVRYLDAFFATQTDAGRTECDSNDELALEFDDIFRAAEDMLQYRELTLVQKHATQALDRLLSGWSGKENADFWRRDALFHDPRWSEIRSCAAKALATLPDQERVNGGSDCRPQSPS